MSQQNQTSRPTRCQETRSYSVKSAGTESTHGTFAEALTAAKAAGPGAVVFDPSGKRMGAVDSKGRFGTSLGELDAEVRS